MVQGHIGFRVWGQGIFGLMALGFGAKGWGSGRKAVTYVSWFSLKGTS